mmetsp:Transcript_25696/g.59469  ORF Transcript_25696/g.59469 Transcript_25696/m.59469 type:complete len:114 (-) Transcript_25696:574-915(-)
MYLHPYAKIMDDVWEKFHGLISLLFDAGVRAMGVSGKKMTSTRLASGRGWMEVAEISYHGGVEQPQDDSIVTPRKKLLELGTLHPDDPGICAALMFFERYLPLLVLRPPLARV